MKCPVCKKKMVEKSYNYDTWKEYVFSCYECDIGLYCNIKSYNNNKNNNNEKTFKTFIKKIKEKIK